MGTAEFSCYFCLPSVNEVKLGGYLDNFKLLLLQEFRKNQTSGTQKLREFFTGWSGLGHPSRWKQNFIDGWETEPRLVCISHLT